MTVYCKRFHCVTPNTARRSFGNVNALSRQGIGSTEKESVAHQLPPAVLVRQKVRIAPRDTSKYRYLQPIRMVQ